MAGRLRVKSVSRIGGNFNWIDGKIGTDRFAVVAVHAKVRLLDRGRMITLGIESRRNFKHIPRTVLDAVTAALAPVFYDVDHPLRYEDFLSVQGNPPEFHFFDPSIFWCYAYSDEAVPGF
jgi:hypothetical protein